MRRLVVGTVMAVITSLLAVLFGQTAANAYSCTSNHYSSDYSYVNYKPGWPLAEHRWRIMAELHYRHCWQGTKHWADPMSFTFGCRRDKNGGVLREATFNPYLWDRDGHSVNPGPATVQCTSKKWDVTIQRYNSMSKFHLCAGGGPRWKVNVKMDIAGDSDKHPRLDGAFWGYTGPVVINC